MSRSSVMEQGAGASILRWAVEHQAPLTASIHSEDGWSIFKSHVIRHDVEQGVLQIAYPTSNGGRTLEIVAGQEIGVAFRRGHKKCLFASAVVVRRTEPGPDGTSIETLVLRMPEQIREVQRRAYVRVPVPPDRFIAVKLWEGGAPSQTEPSWPICSGRLGNASVGGVLVDVRADQNPRLSIGDTVGVEITQAPGQPPLITEAQYRHCATTAANRLGLGFQFVGLEHNLPGRASVSDMADFVRELQRSATRLQRSQPRRG